MPHSAGLIDDAVPSFAGGIEDVLVGLGGRLHDQTLDAASFEHPKAAEEAMDRLAAREAAAQAAEAPAAELIDGLDEREQVSGAAAGG